MSFKNSVEPYTGSMMRASSSSDMIMSNTCRKVSEQQIFLELVHCRVPGLRYKLLC
jgi:hypothetical protein